MVIALTLAGILNYGFNIIMDRMLGTAAYGDFYSLTAIFLIVTLGAASVQAVITKYVAEFEVTGERNRTVLLVRSFTKWLALVGAATVVISIALAWPVERWLKLESPVFVVILGLSIAATLYLTLPFGLLQGQQKFAGLGAAAISGAVIRIITGVLLVLAGAGVYGALGAGAAGPLLVTAAVVYYYRDLYRAPFHAEEDFRPSEALGFLIPVVLAMFFIVLLTQIDAVLVKYYFSRHTAGNYSYAALAGKAVLFFPEGITVVMFPRVNELRVRGEPTRRVLVLSLAAAGLMVGAVAAFYLLFPGFTIYFFAGDRGREVAYLVGLFGLVMAIFSLVKLLAMYHLAMERMAFIWLFVAAGVAEVVGIALFHDNLRQVVMVMLLVSAALLAANLFLAFRESPGKRAGRGLKPPEPPPKPLD